METNCAVVFKAYAWDDFIERQARRLAETAGHLDFYILLDETNGPVGPVPFERVIRFTCDDLAAAGLPMRFGIGGVLWWNPDYAHYHFLDQCPHYDYYLFVESDCVVQGALPQLVARAVAEGADLVALPIDESFDDWHWKAYQHDVYSSADVHLALLNVSLFSARALRHLQQRRIAMQADSSIQGWPSSELFVATEVVHAGMQWVSLAGYGDVGRYDWFPPTMEEDLTSAEGTAFLHPVLDRKRYLSSMLNNAGSLQPGELRRALARFPRQEYARLKWTAARGRAVKRIRHKIIRLRQEVAC